MKQNSIFELVANTNEEVILKINANSSLDIAKHPYIALDYDYITVTKGENHTLTIIRKDGTTFSFDWGLSGYTLITDNLERLKRKTVEFIQSQGVSLEVKTTGKPNKVEIFYNSNLKTWQASLCYVGIRKKEHYYSNNANNELEVLDEIREIYNSAFGNTLIKSKAETGIDVWTCYVE